MTEKERLDKAAALFLEREKREKEVAAINNQIKALLMPASAEKRKRPTMSGRDWDRLLKGAV